MRQTRQNRILAEFIATSTFLGLMSGIDTCRNDLRVIHGVFCRDLTLIFSRVAGLSFRLVGYKVTQMDQLTIRIMQGTLVVLRVTDEHMFL